MTEKIRRYLATHRPPTPCLVVDLDVVEENYRRLTELLPTAEIYYAVKANRPAPSSTGSTGWAPVSTPPASMRSSNAARWGSRPIGWPMAARSKRRDIAAAHGCGVGLFAFDSAASSTSSRAPPRRQGPVPNRHGRSRRRLAAVAKFGCHLDMATDLLERARAIGLDPYGLSFHVGSQQRDVAQWNIAIGRSAMVFSALNRRGIDLKMINLGGGFPRATGVTRRP